MFTLASCNAGVFIFASTCTDPGCQWGHSGEAPCCRRKSMNTIFLGWLCSSRPQKHVILTSYSGPQTSHWSCSLYSDLEGWTWAMKILSMERSLLIAICAALNVWQILELILLKTHSLSFITYYWSISQFEAWTWPTVHLNLQINATMHMRQCHGTGRNRYLGKGEKTGQGEHI